VSFSATCEGVPFHSLEPSYGSTEEAADKVCATRIAGPAIRLALGAQRRDILKMVLRQGLTLAGAGVGLVGALIVSHLMAGLLYGVSPYDLSTFAGVTAVLTAVAASYIPALRAMRLDPITTLHSE
jgi:ABC-type antimicrobial peptide transport system permease subunit